MGKLMRKTKRFTPTVIARFVRQGRGTGTFEAYLPWHQVSRGDPSSEGRSHLLKWRDRLRELLSDGELGAQYFATMLQNLVDSLEQFPLSVEDSAHPLVAYGQGDPGLPFSGTEALARKLGIKHPTVSGDGKTEQWKATTDLVLVFRAEDGRRQMLAIAYKTNDWKEGRRTKQLLSLEREYWEARGVTWLLITPETYEEQVVLSLRRTACWALGDEVGIDRCSQAAQIARSLSGSSVTQVLRAIAVALGDHELAQRALWQAVWSGLLPVDLRRGWRPHVPLRWLSKEEFLKFNPIASRRSAWI